MNMLQQILYKEIGRWVVMFMIGVCTGLVACFIDYMVELGSTLKYAFVKDCILSLKKNFCNNVYIYMYIELY